MTLPVPVEMTATVGQILTAAQWNSNVRDGVNFLINRPLFVGYQNTAESIPNVTYTALAIDMTVVDTYSGHSNTVNNVRYTAQVAGWYRANATAAFASNSTGSRAIVLWVNGSALNYTQQQFGAYSGNLICGTTYPVFLNVGDYVMAVVYQSSGAALSLISGYSGLAVEWVHA